MIYNEKCSIIHDDAKFTCIYIINLIIFDIKDLKLFIDKFMYKLKEKLNIIIIKNLEYIKKKKTMLNSKTIWIVFYSLLFIIKSYNCRVDA